MKIQELLPHLKKGWVAMDKDKVNWLWYEDNPLLQLSQVKSIILSELFDLDPFDGDWKDSLMKCGEKK